MGLESVWPGLGPALDPRRSTLGLGTGQMGRTEGIWIREKGSHLESTCRSDTKT